MRYFRRSKALTFMEFSTSKNESTDVPKNGLPRLFRSVTGCPDVTHRQCRHRANSLQRLNLHNSLHPWEIHYTEQIPTQTA